MAESPEEIFREVVETRTDICRRCFKDSTPTGQESTTLNRAPGCGKDCGHMSATLETDSIHENDIKSRAERLLNLIQQEGYDIQEEVFSEAIEHLSTVDIPPREIFIEAIHVGLGRMSVGKILEEYNLKDKNTNRTRELLRRLPSNNVEPAEIKNIDEKVASEITTFVVSKGPGSDIYHIPDKSKLPKEYHRYLHGGALQTVISENKSWFWNASVQRLENWIEKLDEGDRQQVASVLYSEIRSRPSSRRLDSPTPEEQFRSSTVWAYHKQDATDIMGFLRRTEEPQPIENIVKEVGISQQTTRVLLNVLDDAEPVDRSHDSNWEAI
jgi:hypothetical protein